MPTVLPLKTPQGAFQPLKVRHVGRCDGIWPPTGITLATLYMLSAFPNTATNGGGLQLQLPLASLAQMASARTKARRTHSIAASNSYLHESPRTSPLNGQGCGAKAEGRIGSVAPLLVLIIRGQSLCCQAEHVTNPTYVRIMAERLQSTGVARESSTSRTTLRRITHPVGGLRGTATNIACYIQGLPQSCPPVITLTTTATN
eukprot:CAMPEP_0172758550 /NCGR_PEP_ID=MMETSP1074-20121228/165951_1 /TAXON_ID=2916 /ORGANISM="Ceratium fusus, Strain PA161109" /LENGTH=201 /DNA_ID=CAMNT_0013592169 /DNA_START=84 /DNA_END=689 /DNA_ORIENTATION=-